MKKKFVAKNTSAKTTSVKKPAKNLTVLSKTSL